MKSGGGPGRCLWWDKKDAPLFVTCPVAAGQSSTADALGSSAAASSSTAEPGLPAHASTLSAHKGLTIAIASAAGMVVATQAHLW